MSEDFRSVEFTMDDEPPSLLTPLSDNNFNTGILYTLFSILLNLTFISIIIIYLFS